MMMPMPPRQNNGAAWKMTLLPKEVLAARRRSFFFEDHVPDGVHLLLPWLEWVEMAFQASLDEALLHLHRRIFCLLDQPLNTQHIACVFSFFDKILKDRPFRLPFSSSSRLRSHRHKELDAAQKRSKHSNIQQGKSFDGI
jgi:hypothetical protein